MKQLLLVFIGGGTGSVLRYLIGKLLNNSETGIPYGTFAANILGSLFIGIILGLAAKSETLSQSHTLLLATGFCGGFTTFSTFSIETLNLIESGEIVKAGLNVFLSVVLCISACWIGLIVTRQL